MLKYITENEYVELLGAESVPDNFDNLVIKASAYINKQTYGRVDTNDIPEQVKYVTCLIIQKCIESEQNQVNKQSETVGKWSATYVVKNQEEIEKEFYSILERYLTDVTDANGILLLYRGC